MADSSEDGLHIDAETREIWPFFSPDSPEEFYRQMTVGLPQGTRLGLKLNETGGLIKIEYHYGRKKTPNFAFMYDVENEQAYYVWADVSPSLQKNGIAKTANGHIYRVFQKGGIKNITVAAEKMGAYAHARIGFVPDQESYDWLRIMVERRLDFIESHPQPDGSRLPQTCINALRCAMTSDDLKSFWFIVDQEYPYYGMPLGKLLTFPLENLPASFQHAAAKTQTDFAPELAWLGDLDMTDPDCTQRFEASIYGSPPTKPAHQQKYRLSALGAPR